MTHILVIEDDEAILQNIIDVLELEGYETASATNGAVGINLARRELPDLILCDIMMPIFDGYDVLRELRQDPITAEIPFIFLTALTDRNSMRQGMEMGADDYIPKPFSSEEMLTAIETRLSRVDTFGHLGARELDKAKSSLSRMVAQELQIPLKGINAVIELLSRQRGQLSEQEMDELIELLGTNSRRLTRVVDQLVFTVQIEQGALSHANLSTDGTPMPLRDIRNVAINTARKFAFRNQSLSIQVDEEDAAGMVLCQPAAIGRAHV